MFSLNFDQCPVCKVKLKLTPWMRIKSFVPQPCPHCGAVLVRPWWAPILILIGMETVISMREFDPDLHGFVKQLVLKGHGTMVLTAMTLWGLAGMVMLCAGMYHWGRYRVGGSGKTDNIKQ